MSKDEYLITDAPLKALTVLLHQSNQPDIFLLCFLLFFLYFHDVLMHIRLLFSYLYPFYPLNNRIIPSLVSL